MKVERERERSFKRRTNDYDLIAKRQDRQD